MSEYDRWLDSDLDDYYSDEEEQQKPEWDGPYPEDDFYHWDYEE